MDRGIASVAGGKVYVYLTDFDGQNWKNLSKSNRCCSIKVVQRGRYHYIIQITEDDNPENKTEYILSEKCAVTRTEKILQIAASIPENRPCLLGIKFRDEYKDEEAQFLLRVGEFIANFKKALPGYQQQQDPPIMVNPAPRNVGKTPPNHGYMPPTMAPRVHAATGIQSPDRLPPSASRHPYSGDVRSNQPINNRQDYPNQQQQQQFVDYHPTEPAMRIPYQQHPNRELDYQYNDGFGGGDNYPPTQVRPNPNYRKNEQYHQEQNAGYDSRGGYPGNGRHGDGRQGNGRQGDNHYGVYDRERDFQQPDQRRGIVHNPQPVPVYNPPQKPTPSSYGKERGQDSPATSRSKNSADSLIEFQRDVDHFAQQLASYLSVGDKDQAIDVVQMMTSFVEEQRKETGDDLGMFSMKFETEKKASIAEAKSFSMALLVEALEGESYGVYIDVRSTDTIEYLKLKCQKDFKLPRDCQTWIYGSKVAADKLTLSDLEITSGGETMFIYVQHPKKVKGMTARTMDQVKVEVGVAPSLPHNPDVPMMSLISAHNKGEGYPLEPSDDIPNRHPPKQSPKMPRPQDRPMMPRPLDPPLDLPMMSRPLDPPLDPPMMPRPQGREPISPDRYSLPPPIAFNDQAMYRGPNPAHSLANHQNTPVGGIRVMPAQIPRGPIIEEPRPPSPPADPPKEEVGWLCPTCTFRNLPYRPGCEMCNNDRPEDFVPPRGYQMTQEELKFVEQSKKQDQLLQQMFEEEKERNKKKAAQNYQNLIETDDQALVTNNEVFDCPVCFLEIEPGEGIVLRSCLHKICKDCLHQSVTMSEHVRVQCPFDDGEYQCEEFISDREIRTVLSNEELEAFYNRGLRQAEAAARDSFHCQSTDCPGFCFYEDEVNEFKCIVCGHVNCILCKAQHEDMNCQEYQDDLKIKAANDDAARKTQEMLQKMVADGEGMHCPQCRVIVTKKVGCDWIKCTVCSTEMCWATKGPRWGPAGRGDTSGGCKCGLNRKKCHPNCRNCH